MTFQRFELVVTQMPIWSVRNVFLCSAVRPRMDHPELDAIQYEILAASLSHNEGGPNNWHWCSVVMSVLLSLPRDALEQQTGRLDCMPNCKKCSRTDQQKQSVGHSRPVFFLAYCSPLPQVSPFDCHTLSTPAHSRQARTPTSITTLLGWPLSLPGRGNSGFREQARDSASRAQGSQSAP
jgi:hypothetical protein